MDFLTLHPLLRQKARTTSNSYSPTVYGWVPWITSATSVDLRTGGGRVSEYHLILCPYSSVKRLTKYVGRMTPCQCPDPTINKID